jgi:hypothetical protein
MLASSSAFIASMHFDVFSNADHPADSGESHVSLSAAKTCSNSKT